jgi:hypothetical protein
MEQLVLAPHMTSLADVRLEAVIAGPVVQVPPVEAVDDRFLPNPSHW